jgi:two-component system LytT family sensor kinase
MSNNFVKDIRLNKSDCKILFITYGSIIIFNIAEYFVNGNKLIEYFIDIPKSILTSFSVILVFVYLLIPNFIVKKQQYFKFIALGFTTLVLFGFVDYLIGFWSERNTWVDFPKWDKVLVLSVFRTVNYAGFIFGILLAKKFFESQIRMVNLQKQKNENELKLLRSQIDPHFLFNNLNTLDALFDSKPNVAKKYIKHLSSIYRYLIKTKDEDIMSLEEELAFAKDYIFLINTKFGSDYRFIIEERDCLSNKYLPTGSVQALLENVIKHNIKEPNGKIIDVKIFSDNSNFTVTNIKTGFDTNVDSLGTGLKNLKSRYKLLTDNEITITNTNNQYTVSIPIIEILNKSK